MSAEEFAAETARRVLGVQAEVWDVPPKQGAYDVRLTYPDGRIGALEVTSHAAPGRRHLEGLLHRDNFGWTPPGQWQWWVCPRSPAEVRWLREHYRELILLCEAHGVAEPWQLDPSLLPADVYERACSVDMRGHPDAVPGRSGEARVPRVHVLPPSQGGGVDEELTTLRAALADLLAVPEVSRRTAKVAAAEADEAHLFLNLDYTALPFSTIYGLAFGSALPPEPAPTARGLTHLWLVPRFSDRLLLWDRARWSSHRPFDQR